MDMFLWHVYCQSPHEIRVRVPCTTMERSLARVEELLKERKPNAVISQVVFLGWIIADLESAGTWIEDV